MSKLSHCHTIVILFCLILFANLQVCKCANITMIYNVRCTMYDLINLKSKIVNLKSSNDDSLTFSRREFKKLFNDAIGYFFENHFQQALPPLLKLLRFDPYNSNINFYVGACYMNMPETKVSPIPFLQKAIKSTTPCYDYNYKNREAPVFAWFYLATAYRNNYKIEEVVAYNKIFQSYVVQDNVRLINEIDAEIKNLQNGTSTVYNRAEYTKYFNKPLLNWMQYDVYIKNQKQNTNWWVNNLEGIKRELLVNTILNVACSGKVNVYDENYNLLTNQQLSALVNRKSYKVNSNNLSYSDTLIMVNNQFNPQLITKIRFLEEWYFDDQTMEIGKNVVGLTPLIEEYDKYNSFKGYKPLFSIYFDEKYPIILRTPNPEPRTTDVINRRLSKDSLQTENLINKSTDLTNIIDYSATSKDQTTLTERIRYDVPLNRKSYIANRNPIDNFLEDLFDMVGNGVMQVYDGFNDSLTIRKVRELTGYTTDTLKTRSPYPPFRDTILIISKNVFDYSKVTKFRFLEEWYIDEITSQITKRVIGFAPLVETYVSNTSNAIHYTQSVKGYIPLFWVYFDKKYPVKIIQ